MQILQYTIYVFVSDGRFVIFLLEAKAKKKILCLKAAARICFSVRIWFWKIQTFIFFSWNNFFFIFTTKNEESLLFWKNLST